jgi:hypothetical protein
MICTSDDNNLQRVLGVVSRSSRNQEAEMKKLRTRRVGLEKSNKNSSSRRSVSLSAPLMPKSKRSKVGMALGHH